jgi:hypothetical protein
LGQSFDLANRETLGDDLLCDSALNFGREPEQAAGVALAEAALSDQILDVGRQLEEPQEIGDGATVLTRTVADILVTEVQFLCQALEGQGGLNRIEILALDVLDERDFEEAVILDFANYHRDGLQLGELGRSPSALSGDKLVSVAQAAYHDRLNDAVCSDGLGEFVQALLMEGPAGLQRVGLDLVGAKLCHWLR